MYRYIKGSMPWAVMALISMGRLQAQTDADAIMMGKSLFCGGVMSSVGYWNQYWEGTRLRNNENIGQIRTLMVGPMGSLGVSKNLNLIFSLPYVQTRASAGTLTGLSGMQDISLIAKYRFIRKKSGVSSFSVFGFGGVSTPLTNYVKDLLPVSIGLGTRNLTARAMLDYQWKGFFATVSSSYIARSDIRLDRTAYYTTRMVYSDRVEMPDAMYSNFRTGFRNKEIVAEVVVDQWTTLGGFDITKNNMPFPSNRMNQTRVGLNGKYEPDRWKGLSLTSGIFHTLAGRNMGKATSFQLGVFYIFKLSGKDKPKPQSNPQTN
jgi:hypothetical protein